MAVVLGFALSAVPARGQQTIQYDTVANPYLFLLREPAVLDDLKLTTNQKHGLTALNDRVDGPLLALRNWANDAADTKFSQLVSETESEAGKILSRDQQQRVKQILLRVRGIECVQDEKVAEGLQLSSKQRDAVQKIIKDARSGFAALREQSQAGKPREPLEKEFAKQRSDEQKQILAELTPKQREQLTALLGRSFDVKKLGKVAFKAPELIAGGEWLNSQPLRLDELKGRVVAMHFWTFG